MPEMQPNVPTEAAMQVVLAAPSFEDDIALGCECADPSLQIERWGLEAWDAAAAEAN